MNHNVGFAVSVLLVFCLGIVSQSACKKQSPPAGNSVADEALIKEFEEKRKEWEAFYQEAEKFRLAGKYEDALAAGKKALVFAEEEISPTDTTVGMTLWTLGFVQSELGNQEESEKSYARSLSIFEQTQESDNPGTANIITNLAEVLIDTGQYDKAEQILQKAVAIHDRNDPDAINASTTYYLLGWLYAEQGIDSEALPLVQRAIAIQEKVLGTEHPDLAWCLDVLGDIAYRQGEMDEAESHCSRALVIREKVLGKDHPELTENLNNLGIVYTALGDHDKAESMFTRFLAINEKQLGSDHPDVLICKNRLALVYIDKGMFEEADRLLNGTLGKAEKKLGPDHPIVVGLLCGIATMYIAQENLEEAGPYLKRAMGISEKVTEPDHPHARMMQTFLARFKELLAAEDDELDLTEESTTKGVPWKTLLEDLEIPAEKINGIDALIDDVVEAGFPDGDGATFYLGSVKLASTVDPLTETPAFPARFSAMQMPDPESGKTRYSYELKGLHVRLKDGTWLLEMVYPFREDAQNTIQYDEAEMIDPITLFDEMQVQYDFSQVNAEWLEGYPEDVRERQTRRLNVIMPLAKHLGLYPNQAATAMVLLRRAGMREVPILACMMSDWRSRNYWYLRWWDAAPGPFDPTGQYPGLGEQEKRWRESHTDGFPLEPIDVAFRRELHRVTRNQIASPDDTRIVEPEVAGRLAKMCLDPGDPQGIGPRIDRLVESMAIPKEPGEKASLAERLRSWGMPEEPEMVVKNTPTDDGSIAMTTEYVTPMPAYIPNEKDLDALFGLLGDERVSRYRDFQGSRTVGENAMRAIAQIMGRNPLELVEMGDLSPWTPERRAEAVGKLQQWWSEHKDEYKTFIVKPQ